MKDGHEGSKRFSRRDMLGVGAGAMVAATGVSLKEADARDFTPEDRERIQSKMREVLTETVDYFRELSAKKLDGLSESQKETISRAVIVLEGFCNDAENAMRGVGVDETTNNELAKQIQEVFSSKERPSGIRSAAYNVIAQVELMIKMTRLVFLDQSSLGRAKALDNRLSAISKELHSISNTNN